MDMQILYNNPSRGRKMHSYKKSRNPVNVYGKGRGSKKKIVKGKVDYFDRGEKQMVRTIFKEDAKDLARERKKLAAERKRFSKRAKTLDAAQKKEREKMKKKKFRLVKKDLSDKFKMAAEMKKARKLYKSGDKKEQEGIKKTHSTISQNSGGTQKAHKMSKKRKSKAAKKAAKKVKKKVAKKVAKKAAKKAAKKVAKKKSSAKKAAKKVAKKAAKKAAKKTSKRKSSKRKSSAKKAAKKVAKKTSKRKSNKRKSSKRKSSAKKAALAKQIEMDLEKVSGIKPKRKKSKSKRKSAAKKAAKKKASKKVAKKSTKRKSGKRSKAKSFKKGQSMSFKAGKQRFKLTRTNPFGGPLMKLEAVTKKHLNHDLAEAGGLLAGGALIQGIRHARLKFFPQLSSMVAKVPVLGAFLEKNLDTIIPLAAGIVVNNVVKNDKARSVAKGVIGASVVNIGASVYAAAAKMAGSPMAGIIATPIDGIIGVPEMGAMKMVGDFQGLGAGITDADFGAPRGVGLDGSYMQDADFDSGAPAVVAPRNPDSLGSYENVEYDGEMESDF